MDNFLRARRAFVQNVKLAKFINLYGCTVGHNTKIWTFDEIHYCGGKVRT